MTKDKRRTTDDATEDQPNKATLPDPLEVNMKPHSYQPSKAEMEEEIDMPGWSMDRVRKTFMRPIVTKKS